MGLFFDDIEKNRDLAEALIDLFIEAGTRKAENRLFRTTKKVTDIIVDKIVNHELTDNLTDEQLDAVTAYMEMLLAGFNTYIEQLKSTITPSVSGADSSLKEGAEKNPHNSGN